MSNVRIKLRNVTISYPHLFTPVDNFSKTGKEYSCELRIAKDDRENLETIYKAFKECWIDGAGDDPKRWGNMTFREDNIFTSYLSRDGKDGFPLRDGDKSKDEARAGHVFMNPKARQNAPCVLLLGKKKDGTPALIRLTLKDRIEQEVYPGCKVDAFVDVYYLKEKDGGKVPPCLGLSLDTIVKVGDGERLAGSSRTDVAAEYGVAVEEGTAEIESASPSAKIDDML